MQCMCQVLSACNYMMRPHNYYDTHVISTMRCAFAYIGQVCVATRFLWPA